MSVVVVALGLLWTWSPQADAVTLTGALAENAVFGGKKADKLTGANGIDYIFGKSNPRDTVDKLFGLDGDDVLIGGRGADVSKGGLGEDHIVDTDGKPGDRLKGEEDDDVLISWDGAADRLDCGGGAGDFAVADPKDSVSASCETVLRESAGLDKIYSLYGGGDDSGSPAVNLTFFWGMGKGDDTVNPGFTDFPFNTIAANANTEFYGGAGQDSGTPSGTGYLKAYDDDGTDGDTLIGAGAGDLLISADGGVDTITCGGGTDIVYADVDDVINDPGNCETLKQFDQQAVALT